MNICAHTIIANPVYTMAEIPLLLTDTAFRQQLLANVKDQKVRRFWEQYELVIKDRFAYSREIPPILNKLDPFLQPMLENIVGQARTTIPMLDIMNQGKILLVKFQHIF